MNDEFSVALRTTIIIVLDEMTSNRNNWHLSSQKTFDVDQVFEWLADGSPILEEPHRAIGLCLYDEQEATTLHQLALLLDTVFQRIGNYAPDVLWLQQPEWANIAAQAQKALEMMQLNDRVQIP